MKDMKCFVSLILRISLRLIWWSNSSLPSVWYSCLDLSPGRPTNAPLGTKTTLSIPSPSSNSQSSTLLSNNISTLHTSKMRQSSPMTLTYAIPKTSQSPLKAPFMLVSAMGPSWQSLLVAITPSWSTKATKLAESMALLSLKMTLLSIIWLNSKEWCGTTSTRGRQLICWLTFKWSKLVLWTVSALTSRGRSCTLLIQVPSEWLSVPRRWFWGTQLAKSIASILALARLRLCWMGLLFPMGSCLRKRPTPSFFQSLLGSKLSSIT